MGQSGGKCYKSDRFFEGMTKSFCDAQFLRNKAGTLAKRLQVKSSGQTAVFRGNFIVNILKLFVRSFMLVSTDFLSFISL